MAIGVDQAAAPLEVGDIHILSLGQMQGGLDATGLLALQVEQYFGLDVVDDILLACPGSACAVQSGRSRWAYPAL